MLKAVKSYVLGPLSTRLGVFLAGALGVYGVHADVAHALALGIVACLLIACDLILAQLRKVKIIRDTLDGRYDQ